MAMVVLITLIVMRVYFMNFNNSGQLWGLRAATNFSVPYVPRAFENAVCTPHYRSISVWNMIGHALNHQKIYWNPVLFDFQMQYFFGACSLRTNAGYLTNASIGTNAGSRRRRRGMRFAVSVHVHDRRDVRTAKHAL
jgi:hypothetical protein